MTTDVRIFANRYERWLRLGALFVGLLFCAGVVLFVVGDGPVGMGLGLTALALSVVNFWLLSSSRTVIDGDRVSIRVGARRRHVPVTDVVEVVHLTRWSPVRLRLRSGEVLDLPMVQPEDADEVRRLLGRNTG